MIFALRWSRLFQLIMWQIFFKCMWRFIRQFLCIKLYDSLYYLSKVYFILSKEIYD